MVLKGVIRPLAVCIIKHGDRLLAGDGYDPKKDEYFYRLLGGGIEFGETGEQALKREFQEELGTNLENVKYITILENIFTFNGKQGHEIVMVFTGDLVNKDLYQKDKIELMDVKEKHMASWQKISDYKDKKIILYPNGILKYL